MKRTLDVDQYHWLGCLAVLTGEDAMGVGEGSGAAAVTARGGLGRLFEDGTRTIGIGRRPAEDTGSETSASK